MHAETSQIAATFLYFLGVALFMWRAPRADRWHVLLCLAAVALWAMVALIEPRARTWSLAVSAASFLAIGLFRAYQRQPADQR